VGIWLEDTVCKADWEERINIDADIQGGKPVIKGTRVPVEVIVGALAESLDVQDVCNQFRITEADVKAALCYATEELSHWTVRAIPAR
jgi:uncharacterized protein (DUF433 family)